MGWTNLTLNSGLMLKEFYRILKTGGLMVALTAKKEEFENILDEYKDKIILKEKYNILVSGKKAGIYKIVKI